MICKASFVLDSHTYIASYVNHKCVSCKVHPIPRIPPLITHKLASKPAGYYGLTVSQVSSSEARGVSAHTLHVADHPYFRPYNSVKYQAAAILGTLR